MRLDGKVALITGGGGGIGAAIAECFIAEGAKVCIADVRDEMLAQVAASLSSATATTCRGDVTRLEDAKEMVRTAAAFGGKLDILVNCAGIDAVADVVHMELGQWDRVHDVNVTGPFLLSKAAIPRMIEAGGGAIVNISSVAGVRTIPGMPAYSSSKGALIMLTKQIAVDFGRHGVRCNAILPGPVRTGLLDSALAPAAAAMGIELQDLFDRVTESVPLKRSACPREIAAACVFLAGDEASFITGAALTVDGGLTAVDPMGVTLEQLGLLVH